MKFRKFSEAKQRQTKKGERALLEASQDYQAVVGELEADFEHLKKTLKGSSISPLEVWVELAVKQGIMKEEDAKKLLAANEAAEPSESKKFKVIKALGEAPEVLFGEGDVLELVHDNSYVVVSGLNPGMELELSDEEVKGHLAPADINEAAGDDENEKGGDEEGKKGEGDEATATAELEKVIDAAMKDVINHLPKELEKVTDTGEIELVPKLDAEADGEVQEAVGSLIVGGALALPAVTQLFGKAAAWAGTKMGSGDLAQFGKATEKIGHDLHHKYLGLIQKTLSPLTKKLDKHKQELVANCVFYAIIATVGGLGVSGALHAAGHGATGLAAVEGGLSAVKASELATAATEVLPSILAKVVQAAA